MKICLENNIGGENEENNGVMISMKMKLINRINVNNMCEKRRENDNKAVISKVMKILINKKW